MRIGLIGAGAVARTLGRHFIHSGNEVVISNSRGPQSLKALIDELGPRARAGTREEAVQTDLVILCVNWTQARAALDGLPWNGRILVDATDPASPLEVGQAELYSALAYHQRHKSRATRHGSGAQPKIQHCGPRNAG